MDDLGFFAFLTIGILVMMAAVWVWDRIVGWFE